MLNQKRQNIPFNIVMPLLNHRKQSFIQFVFIDGWFHRLIDLMLVNGQSSYFEIANNPDLCTFLHTLKFRHHTLW